MHHISVVVCCYNSSTRLPKTLEALASQSQTRDIRYELVVVDNNSSDTTTETALAEWQKLGQPFPLTVVSEDRPGLSNARRKGVQTAHYEYVCFCDDDNWLGNDYLKIAAEIMDSDPNIGILAGQGVAVAEISLPNWFYSYYSNFACGVLARESGDVTSRSWVWGAGMVVRRSVFLNLVRAGFEHQTLDRVGATLTSGGDNEISYWHVLTGFKLWYDERLVFKHWMSNERLTKEYLSRLSDGQTESAKKLELYRRVIEMNGRKRNLKGLMKAIVHWLVNEKRSIYVRIYLPFTLDRNERVLLKNVQSWITNYRKLTQ